MGQRPACATLEIKSINSDMDPTHVVSSDGSKAEPAASRPLRDDDDDEFRELTLAHRGIARAPRYDKKSQCNTIDINDAALLTFTMPVKPL